MGANHTTVRKLQNAINAVGGQVLINSNQFYSESQQRAVTVYHIKQAIPCEITGKFMNVELFSSTSQIQIILFLRDLWYELNGWELPTDNEMWNEIKKKRAEEQ